MPVKFRDYYDVLGLERSATKEEIRKAFRKLAREHHPDVAKDKSGADAKFKELNEAYEVLSDPEKRKKYDRLGPDWEHMGDFSPPPGSGGFGSAAAGGGDYHFEGAGFSDFFEQLFGRRSDVGGFSSYGGMGGPRRAAGGRPQAMRGRDIEAEILVTVDEIMHGSERSLTMQRPAAPGRSGGRDTVRIRIPKGVSDGQLIRCAGLGEPGYDGGGHGDLFLRVIVQRHPDFTIEGHDLHYDLGVAPWDAVLGAKATAPTPHGDVKFKIPAGSADGTLLRLRGKGLPTGSDSKTGDMYVKIHIEVPGALTDKERELWEQLRDQSDFDPLKR